uniref:Glucoside xylosyltransferase 1b n=1 Tax=Cyprinus carpio TaxID=7962 RepID=A0A8C1ZUY8_CYPCA
MNMCIYTQIYLFICLFIYLFIYCFCRFSPLYSCGLIYSFILLSAYLGFFFLYVAQKVNSPGQREPLMQLAVVACGERHREAVNMLKTAAMLSSRALRFHIFAEKQLHTNIKTAVSMSRLSFLTYIHANLCSLHNNEHKMYLLYSKTLHSAIPFFSLQMILKEVDSLLYVDTEVLLLQPVELIWTSMTLEHKKPWIAWYSRFSRHPYYGKTGINSGVMLMNLTRMRITHFNLRLEGQTPIFFLYMRKYKLNIIWGDQDLINCTINSDHCIYGSNCVPAEEEGVFTLHGNRGVLHSDKPPAFKAVYDAFKHVSCIRGYTFGEDLIKSFLLPLEEALNETTHTYCGKVSHFLTRGLGKSVRKLQGMTPAGG